MPGKKDNSCLVEKLALRREVFAVVGPDPVVLDGFCGMGVLYDRLYSTLRGVAMDIDDAKAEHAARVRPRWTVIQGRVESAIEAGLLAQYPFTFIDLDAYGNPWPCLDAVVRRAPPSSRYYVVVTDGMRSKIKIGDGFGIESIRPMVARYGSRLHRNYLAASRWFLENKGARVESFRGLHAGHAKQMTLWWARIVTPSEALSPSSESAKRGT